MPYSDNDKTSQNRMMRLRLLLPSWLREWMSPFLSKLYIPVQFFESVDSNNIHRSLAYLGVNKNRARLWAKRLLGPDNQETSSGRTWVVNYERYIKKTRPEIDYVLIETNRFTDLLLAGRKAFRLPMWIQLNIDTSRSFEELKSSSVRLRIETPRLMRKHSLEVEISNSKDDLDEFVRSMHIPYISGRHNKTAFFSSNEEIERVFEYSDLLFINQNGNRIAGVLYYATKKDGGIHYLGVKDNNPEYMKQGAVAAIYYYSIERAISQGCQRLNLGGSNPFLCDGLTFFKLTMRPYASAVTYLIDYPVKFICRGKSPHVDEFLIHNPFVCLLPGGRIEKVYHVDTLQPGYADLLKDLEKKTRCANLARITVYRRGDLDKDAEISAIINNPDVTVAFRKWD